MNMACGEEEGREVEARKEGKANKQKCASGIVFVKFFLFFFNHDDNPNDTTPENDKISVKGYNL